jgi:hypothetical protein
MNFLKLLAITLLMVISTAAFAWDAPWDRDGHDRWGHRGSNNGFGDFWDDGFGDIFGDAFGDVDFEMKFRVSGDGWGRGWGDNMWNGRNRYYNGYNGYHNYRRAPYRGAPYGYGYPRYGSQPLYPYAPPLQLAPAPTHLRAVPPPPRNAAAPAQRRTAPPSPRQSSDSTYKQHRQQ